MLFPRSSFHTLSQTFRIPARSYPLNSAPKPLTPQTFQRLPALSKASKKVIDTQCTSMLLSCVLPNQNLRLRSAFRLRHHSSVRSELSSSQNLQLSNLPTFKHALDRHCDEKPLIANPLVPAGCKCPLPQPLSVHILTNAPGVCGGQCFHS